MFRFLYKDAQPDRQIRPDHVHQSKARDHPMTINFHLLLAKGENEIEASGKRGQKNRDDPLQRGINNNNNTNRNREVEEDVKRARAGNDGNSRSRILSTRGKF